MNQLTNSSEITMYSGLKLFRTLDIENPQENLPTLSQWFTITVSKKKNQAS